MEARYSMYKALIKEFFKLNLIPSKQQFIQHISNNFDDYEASVRVAFDSDMSVEECINDLIYKARMVVK